jgi:hypothetical protein
VLGRAGQNPYRRGASRQTGPGILVWLAVGLHSAVINVFALQFTQGQAIVWQNPLVAMLDALQPGVVEEIIYHFALWGLFWVICDTRNPIKQIGFLAC